MSATYKENENFNGGNFTREDFIHEEYENCSFTGCDFSEANLSTIKFYECRFIDCNLSLAILVNTLFREVNFSGCKMLGLKFENCRQATSSLSFERCNLSHASFYQANGKKTIFKNCMLLEVDFVNADFSGASFDESDLSGAVFENTILIKTDFSSAFNYTINPGVNRVKKAKFSLPGLPGLLAQYDLDIVG
ncbi:MAG: pentapeptide repeat-containing protein [Ferruginibacter sp.]